MTWQFYGGTIDPGKRTRENIIFFFAMDPRKIIPMMDDTEGFDPALIQKLVANKRAAVIGRERLEAMQKRVGDRITVTSMNYQDINLEFEIVGMCPEGRYNQSAFMNRDYLNDALDAYPKSHGGEKHPLAGKCLNLVWLRVRNQEDFRRLSEQIMTSAEFSNPAVKCETFSSGMTAFLDAYRDLLWGMKWLLVPATLLTMTLVVTNAISISIRERRTELAVLKVLGFRPGQLMVMVLGEALLIGGGSGLISAGGTYLFFNKLLGGVKFPIAFFPTFYVPADAWWWGLAMGATTALLGSLMPALSARTVKVSEVFSKIA
jgi:putative ABC transport system permease protein